MKADSFALAARPARASAPVRRRAAWSPNWRGLRLRTRLTILLLLALALLAGGFGLVALQLSNAAEARLSEATLNAQAQMLRKVLERQGDAVVGTARRLIENPAFIAAMRRRDAAAIAAAVNGFAQADARPDLLRIEVVDTQERVLHSFHPLTANQPALEAGSLARVLERGMAVVGPSREADGTLVLRSAVPIRLPAERPAGSAASNEPPPIVGALTFVLRLTAALQEVAASSGSEVLLLDQRAKLIETTSVAVWNQLGGAADQGIGTRSLRVGDRTLAISVVPLLDSVGGRLGSEMQVHDITDADDERRFTTAVSAAGVLLFLILLPVLLYWIIDRAFRPLDSVVTALDALSAGNTEVEVAGEARQDEVGAIARAVRVFRDRNRDLARQRLRQERGRRRQHRFIRQQMVQMGETLDADGRADMLADTESIEGALLQMERMDGQASGQAARGGDDLGVLALAFKVMSLRVITQHRRMDTLVLELRDALRARTELIGLQQQFEITTRMQSEMLPQALPPRPDVQARGGLLPAREFGGDFYDFFPLGPTQIAIVAGNVSGGGLQGAFLTLTARTLLKAVLVCGLGPGAAMTRVNGLLAAENHGGLSVAALVALMDTRTSRLTCCGAHFPAPLLLHRLGDAAALALPDNPLLGQQSRTQFRESQFDLAPRTTLVVHTPGMAGGDDAAMLAVLRACNDPGAEAVLNAVMSMASTDRGAAERDASCVVIRYAAAAA